MRILFTSPATLQVCGGKWYNNAIASVLPRYKQFADEIILANHVKEADVPAAAPVPMDNVQLVKIEKVNSLGHMIEAKRKNSTAIARALDHVDACICHVPSDGGFEVARQARRRGIPALMVVIGCPWDALWNYSWKGKLVAPFRWWAMRRTLRHATHAIYVTHSFLQHRYPTSGRAIGCSDVDLPALDVALLDRRLEHLEDHTVLRLATLGGLDVTYKGQHKVLRAIARLRDEGIRLEYHVAGAGSPDKLVSLAEELGLRDQFFSHGSLPHTEVFHLLDETDIYIQPSDVEGLPRALVEAMSRACPAIGTTVGGIPELLPPEVLFARHDVDGLVAAIRSLLPKEARQRAAERNFNVARSYERATLDRQFNDFLHEFITYAQQS